MTGVTVHSWATVPTMEVASIQSQLAGIFVGGLLGGGFGYGENLAAPFCIEGCDAFEGSFLKWRSRSLKTYVFVTFLFVMLMVNSLGIFAFEGVSGSTSLMSCISANNEQTN